MLAAGTEIERYVVEALLGEGGMAQVYRVRHSTLGSRHALKILTLSSRTVRERLLQEGRLQATLKHPNIVAVSDVLTTLGGEPGLLMEFVEGPSLERWLQSYTPTLDEALAIFRGVVAGVCYAHDRGLIHRDLKPSNVLLQVSGLGLVPKVADFGLAKALESDGGVSRTRQGATMGTPSYMAPEQIRDASAVDRRADLFSLGAILYELLSGRQAFPGHEVLAIMNAVTTGAYVPLERARRDLPANLCALVADLLAVDPEARVPDCRALLDRLDGPPVDGRPRSQLPTLIPEDAPGAVAARELTLSVTEELPSISETWIEAPREPTLAAPAPRGVPWLAMGAGLAGLCVVVALAVGVGVAVGALAGGRTEVVRVPVPAVEPVEAVAPSAGDAPAPAPPVDGAPPTPEPPVAPKRAAPVKAAAASEPAPPRPTSAAVALTGDATLVMLVSDTGEFSAAGAVPAGTYTIKAWFGAPDPVAAGRLTLEPGERVTLHCVAGMLLCVRK